MLVHFTRGRGTPSQEGQGQVQDSHPHKGIPFHTANTVSRARGHKVPVDSNSLA